MNALSAQNSGASAYRALLLGYGGLRGRSHFRVDLGSSSSGRAESTLRMAVERAFNDARSGTSSQRTLYWALYCQWNSLQFESS
jgi:hypothetical protein